MDLECDVCIVGAGPGGALLGYLLAKNNLSTIVIERHEGLDKEFRGEHLNRDGEDILKKYNLFKKVEKSGILLMESIEYWQHGKVFKTVTPSEEEKHVGIHVPQKHLLSVLLNEAAFFPNFKLLTGTRAVSLMNDNGAVTGIVAKKGEEEVIIRSSIVVGADGRFSTIRKLAGIPFTKIAHDYDLLWAKIPCPEGWTPTIRQTLIGEKQLALFSQAGNYIQIGWNIEKGTFPALKVQSFTPFIKLAIEAFPDLKEMVQKHVQSWQDFILLNVHSCKCQSWVQDGLVLMGDAAHTMSPTGAYGLNCALKDASALYEVITAAQRRNDFSENQLKTFEYMRRGEVEGLQANQIIQEEAYSNNFVSA
ncbi:FAD-dependent monooxygenase [Cytobacillus purgationiresistens]|uniref:2-polyprenyl-6-methoxyphenol hydroxylase-like FAD-dependent oxidoreductase n=1 Tax=Cytobacillus purgationiresistens TaxID=863449 RepID=A0ABU0AH06_9BACI|nr:FAD-dependent monooxygenase [Cytobacillus purgationiresistens]MDQ0270533.1 2-polyprenyl-6-methoxyphenol hydroxylase-like FAD-dependent oxidoreductase [Cytobacillus purgationiresistens]